MDGDKSEFLACYDYGMGGLWGVILARSEEEVTAKYPELVIVAEPPPWMVGEHLERVVSRRYDIDEEPHGMLKAVVSDRGK